MAQFAPPTEATPLTQSEGSTVELTQYSTVLLAIRRAMTMLGVHFSFQWKGRQKMIRTTIGNEVYCPLQAVFAEKKSGAHIRLPRVLAHAFMLAADGHPSADPDLRYLLEVVTGLKVVSDEARAEVVHFMLDAPPLPTMSEPVASERVPQVA